MEKLLNKEEAPELTTQSLNELLNYYLLAKQNLNFIKLLYKVGKERNLLNTESFAILMKKELLLKQGTFQNCLNYYEEAKLLEEFNPTPELYLTLLEYCIKTSKFDKLNYIQKELEHYQIPINIDIINNLLQSYLNFDQNLEKFMELVNYYEQQNIAPNVQTYELIALAYEKFNQIHFGYNLVEKMIQTNQLEPSMTIVKKLNLNAVEVLDLLKRSGLSPSLGYFNDCINWKIKQNLFSEAFEWSKLLVENNHSPNTITYTLLLDALVKGERVDKAFELFDEMKTLGIALDQRVFLILIEGLNRKGDFNASLGLLDQMIKKHNLKPNQFIFNNLLGYCSKQKDLEGARKIRGLMKEHGCVLDTRGYNCMFTLNLDTDKTLQCWKLYKDMRTDNVPADQLTYSLLIDKANRELNTSKMMRVYEDMINSQIYPNPAQFEVILKQLFSQSEIDQFLEVWSKFISLKLIPTQTLMQVILNFCYTYKKHEITKLSYQYLVTLVNSGNLINFEPSTWQLLMDQYLNQNDYLGFEEIYYLVCDKLKIQLDREILEEWLKVVPQDCNISFRLRVDLENVN
ncbi:hypothetical protein CONCODRAFT_71256 [Conidiobolus coronatus NRRL 28638]|uniref:PROP1-like PPR domain-containing protein n=1 Tax=Conidiobolus coronatus (strain ATCC 28846 / CBS 209.66 / NRRL 28638) TaxID=796925 RepID=A0A137P3Z1_CONC2|nr:hypothetical protein CONCODRAFT_71256 [Conidiobolus coronatus NRRL 28638]|eukprot:KXN69740.1 hypothetical protein CONCODRAFT_71256 [Conidiobolus coronatus NRRL 28638]